MAEPVRGATTDPVPPAANRTTRRVAGLLVVVLLAPFAALVVWALRHTVYSAGDLGMTEGLVRSVGTSTTPLLGAYSRYGWHHPGPLLFYALAGPYRLLGADGSALAASAVVLNGLSVLAIAYLLWRRGGLGGLVAGSVVVVLLLRALGNDFLVSSWNPALPVLPVLVYALALWVLLDGRPWMLVLMVVTGSFAVQSHVGTAVVVLAGLLVACGSLIRHRRSRPAGRAVWITAGVTAVALWAAPILEALRHGGGNLKWLSEFWTSSHDRLTGWSAAGRIVTSQLAVGAPWLTGHERVQTFDAGLDPPWRFPVLGLVFVVAVVIAWRRRDRAALQLGAVTAGFSVIAFVSVARIVDQPIPYLVRWVFLAGVLAGLTIAWTVLGLVRTLPARAATAVGVAAALVVVAVAGAMALTSDATRPTFPTDARIMARLAPGLDRHVADFREPVLVSSVADMGSGGLSDSTWAALLDRGVDARLPRAEGWKIGPVHTVRASDAGTHLVTAVGDQVAVLKADARYRVIASFDGLSARRRAELERLKPDITDEEEYFRWAMDHPDETRRINRLERQGLRAAIFEVRD